MEHLVVRGPDCGSVPQRDAVFLLDAGHNGLDGALLGGTQVAGLAIDSECIDEKPRKPKFL